MHGIAVVFGDTDNAQKETPNPKLKLIILKLQYRIFLAVRINHKYLYTFKQW